MMFCGFQNVSSNDEMPKITFLHVQIRVFYIFNHRYFGISKSYFFLLGCEGKIEILRGYCGGKGPNLYTMPWALFDDVEYVRGGENDWRGPIIEDHVRKGWRGKVRGGYPSWIG